jgi:hypothetical protein
MGVSSHDDGTFKRAKIVAKNLRGHCLVEKDFVGWVAYFAAWNPVMELRHLRYFIAVVDAGSLTTVAG